MTAYYNEIDPHKAAWLRELIKRDLIAPGEVDERSVKDVQADDLMGFTQCHFFAGIGIWSYALRQAGWPDDRPVWTGSCPCQSFSAAGKGLGKDDPRHLWPDWFKLIEACKPPVVFGEQVASNLIIGRVNRKNKGVHQVWGRKTLLRFLRELEREQAGVMQGLHEEGGEVVETCQCRPGESGVLGLAGQEAGPCVDECSEAPCENTGDTFRVRPRGYPGSGGPGCLRVDRDTFHAEQAAIMGRSIDRPDNSWERVHEGEHKGGVVRSERDGEHMGGEQNRRGVPGHHGKEAGRIGQFIEEISGEVGSEDGGTWFDSLCLDLERTHYAVGACVAPACGIGAPHIRSRLYWVGHSHGEGLERRSRHAQGKRAGDSVPGSTGRLADTGTIGREWRANTERPISQNATERGEGLPDVKCGGIHDRPRPTNGHWRDADWLLCRDGKWRPVESWSGEMALGLANRLGYSSFGDRYSLNPLIQKAENRAMRLKGYGDGIVSPQAQAFIEAYLERLL